MPDLSRAYRRRAIDDARSASVWRSERSKIFDLARAYARGNGRRDAAFRRNCSKPSSSGSAPSFSDISGLVEVFDWSADNVSYDDSHRLSLITGTHAGHDATAVGTARPLWSATGLLGGPAAYFSGDDYLTIVDGLAEKIDASQPFSLVCVLERDSATAHNTVFCGANSGANDTFYCRFNFSGSDLIQGQRRNSVPTEVNTNGASGSGADPVICWWFYDGSAWTFRIDGSDVAGGANAIVANCDTAYIGARWNGSLGGYFSGWIGTIAIYDSVLGTSDRETVESIINAMHPGLSGTEAPETIPGLLAWWDPDSGVTRDGSDRVESWVSREGHGHELTAAGSARPLWESSSILGESGLYFTTDDVMEGAPVLAGLMGGSRDYTLVIVNECTAPGGSQYGTLFSMGTDASSTNQSSHRVYDTTGNDRHFRNPDSTSPSSAGSQVLTSPNYLRIDIAGDATLETSVDDTASIASEAQTGEPSFDRTYLGASRYNGSFNSYLQGRIAQIFVYDHILTAGQWSTLKTFIEAEYSGI